MKRVRHILAVLVFAYLLLGSIGQALEAALDSVSLLQSAHSCCHSKAVKPQTATATLHASTCNCQLSNASVPLFIAASPSSLSHLIAQPVQDSNPDQGVQAASAQERIWLRKLYYPDKSRLFLRKRTLLL